MYMHISGKILLFSTMLVVLLLAECLMAVDSASDDEKEQ